MPTPAPSLPPFKKLNWLKRDIELVKRDDGSMVLRSRVPLQAYPMHIPSLLHRWADERPEQTWIAQRRGPDDAWLHVTYAQARQTVDALTQALLDLGAGPDKPVAILSGNSIEHALMTMAAMQAGAPAAPVSPAYSLLSQDHVKLRHIFELVRPAVVMVQDGPSFAKALAALHLRGVTLVHVQRAPEGLDSRSYAELAATVPTPAVAAALAALTPDSVGKLLFTSGSTGMPKAVINTQRMMCANLAMSLQTRQPDADDEPPVVLDWLPWNHTMGGNATLHAAGPWRQLLHRRGPAAAGGLRHHAAQPA
jgi:feruloyl-CoA synthase